MKNIAIGVLLFCLIFCITVLIINSSRTWDDGIEKAERHHLLTGEYYNKYSKIILITTEGDSIVDYILETKAEFSETYWENLTELNKKSK